MSPTVVPTATPTAQPTATPSASQGVRPLPDGVLAAGTYSMADVAGVPGITATITVPDGWHGIPGFGGLVGPTDRSAPLGLGINFMQTNGVFDDPCRWDKAGTGDTHQPGEKAVGPSGRPGHGHPREQVVHLDGADRILIDGHPGKQVDIQLPTDLDFARCSKEKGDTAGNYYVFTPPSPLYAQGPGNRWHAHIIDLNGSRVIVLVWDYEITPTAVRADAQKIVDSIKFSK